MIGIFGIGSEVELKIVSRSKRYNLIESEGHDPHDDDPLLAEHDALNIPPHSDHAIGLELKCTGLSTAPNPTALEIAHAPRIHGAS